jgi:hypothetical protein
MSIEPIKDIRLGDFNLFLFRDGDKEYAELWNCGDMEFVLNFHPTKAQMQEIIRVYTLGMDAGKNFGRNEIKREFRKLLELASLFDIENLGEHLERHQEKHSH